MAVQVTLTDNQVKVLELLINSEQNAELVEEWYEEDSNAQAMMTAFEGLQHLFPEPSDLNIGHD